MIKNTIRPRASSERLDKLVTLENQTSLDWVMKNSQVSDMKSNIKMIPKDQLSLKISSPEHEGVATIWSHLDFGFRKISQFRGLLIYDNEFCLILNDCFIEKRRFQQSHFRAYFIKLTNLTGQLVLIFSHPISLKQWSQCIKKYCKRKEFYKKYRISDKICQNLFAIQHKRSKSMFSAQIINLSLIKNYYQAEILDNYLKILRNSTITNYPEIEGVFEEKQILFIVGKHFKGKSLDQYFSWQAKDLLNQQELATIVFSILVALKSLNDEELYHGNVTFENILCYQQSKVKLGVYLINSYYKSYEKDDMEQYNKTIPSYLIAPELLHNGHQPSIASDLFQLGIVIGLITFFQFKEPFSQEYAANQSQKLLQLIQIEEKKMINQERTEYLMLHSLSQLELIKKLISPNVQSRISIQDALKHTWFVTNKEKMMNKLQTKRTSLFPSLRTIIEIKEQSECDIKRTLQNLQDETSQKFFPDPFSLVNQQMKQNSLSFTDFNEEDDDALQEQIQRLNQQEYQLIPSIMDHTRFHKKFE